MSLASRTLGPAAASGLLHIRQLSSALIQTLVWWGALLGWHSAAPEEAHLRVQEFEISLTI